MSATHDSRGSWWAVLRVFSASRQVTLRVFGASRQAAPGVGSYRGGRCCASTSLRCSVRGRAAELASFAALTALKQPRRVSLRSALRAPTSNLRSPPPQKSPTPGATCREARGRGLPIGAPPSVSEGTVGLPQRFSKGAFGLGASLRGRRRGAEGAWPRAQRVLSSDSPRLSEHSERSERSEFCGGPRDRAPQSSRRAATTAEAKRRAQPERAFAALDLQPDRASAVRPGHAFATLYPRPERASAALDLRPQHAPATRPERAFAAPPRASDLAAHPLPRDSSSTH